MKVLIIYERKTRELSNSILIKAYLEKIGHECSISQFYEATKFRIHNKKKYDVILVPHCYISKSIDRVFSRFGKSNIYNLQYEQVLSDDLEKLGSHNPKGEAIKATHMCWGELTLERLKVAGVPLENLHLIKPLHLDLLHESLRFNLPTKDEFALKYNLDKEKKWNLFISSFTYADIDDNRLKMNENVAGMSLFPYKEVHTKSRNGILKWFESVLQIDKETIFIYRPHPDELSFDKVKKLEDKYENFRIINDLAVKNWIAVCDIIFSWYSTSVVESHFLDKEYGILRPFVLPDWFDSVLIKKAKFITSYSDFKDFYLGNKNLGFAIEDKFINGYYTTSQNKLSFKLLTEKLEVLAKQSIPDFKIDLFQKIKAFLNTFFVSIIYLFYKKIPVNLDKYRNNEKLTPNFFIRWFIEFDNQIVGDLEISEKVRDIKKMLFNE